MTAKTSFKTRLGFAAGEFSSSIFFTITSFWLMIFLTDEVRLSAALAGTALLVGKIWDAVIDPFIGHFSDRTRSRWGRRRPYLLYFSIPFAIAFVIMFINPGIEAQAGKFLWVMLIYMLLCTVYSFTNIPYNALLPEMTDDYNERTSISGFKQMFAVLGTLLGAGAALPLMNLFATRTMGFTGMAAIFAVLIVVSLLVTFFSVHERTLDVKPVTDKIWNSLKDVFANRPYMLLLASWFTNSTAVAVAESMLVYYYKYIFQAEAAVTLAMITLLVVTIASIPFWVWLAKRLSKNIAYIIGMAFWAVVQILIFTIQPGQVSYILILAVAAGISVSTAHVLPDSIFPDVIEWDELRTGRRQEGIYYGVKNFIRKLTGALAIFIALQVLGWVGYQSPPEGATFFVQSPATLTAIRLLIGPLGAVLLLSAIAIAWFYPLTREKHGRIRRLLAHRRKKAEDKKR